MITTRFTFTQDREGERKRVHLHLMIFCSSADTDAETAVTRWHDDDMNIHRSISGLFLLETLRMKKIGEMMLLRCSLWLCGCPNLLIWNPKWKARHSVTHRIMILIMHHDHACRPGVVLRNRVYTTASTDADSREAPNNPPLASLHFLSFNRITHILC